MFAKVLLIENDAELLKMLEKVLNKHGFTSIVPIGDTANIVQRVLAEYDGPSIIVTDYFIDPLPPSRFIPQMRDVGLNLPVVIMSGSLRGEQLNNLALSCRLAGFFPKDGDANVMSSLLAQHLMDLNPDANNAWRYYRYRQDAQAFIDSFSKEECAAFCRLMALERPKEIAGEGKLTDSGLYSLVKELKEFLGRPAAPEKQIALINAIQVKLGAY